jgi:hypothetical protein
MLIKDRLLMKRRREHGECDIKVGGRGCLVYGTKVCEFRRAKQDRWQRFKEKFHLLTTQTSAMWWLLCAFFGVCLALGLNLLLRPQTLMAES